MVKAPADLKFCHPRPVLSFWRALVRPLLGRQPTPFYLFSAVPIRRALAELQTHFGHLPVRHWLSFKTQPLRPLLQWWRRQGLGVEVVSEFEFRAARAEGFLPDKILVNGPAKHHWLPRQPTRGLFVNFDSAAEARALAPLAKKLDWRAGVRVHTREEFDPERPEFPTQFGLPAPEAVALLKQLRRAGLRIEMIHFHLRTNVASPAIYGRALAEVADVCRAAAFAPKYVDCGGGFPPPHVCARDGQAVAADFDLAAMTRVYERALQQFPGVRELWLENGRWLSARSGVLVIRVLDAKPRGGMRYLICDGGRTMNALLSTWEEHALITLPHRRGPTCPTTVTGPTCMAFDQLARRPLPRSWKPGDHLIWLEAGAYHLPWETRFSHGLAAVFWHDGRTTRRVRVREKFDQWWAQWK
jgi:diaminopimelate decarboxylase